MSENFHKWREAQVRKLDLLYDQGRISAEEYNRRLDELYTEEK